MSKVDIKVPDIGDFTDVEIIEVLVSEGEAIEAEASLITLETDKASMEVPATDAGTIVELTVKVGDTVSEGDVIGTLETDADAASDDADDDSDDSGDSDDDDDAATEEDAGDESRDDDAAETDKASSSGGESIDVAVPDIGESSDVEVIEVLVAVGDTVEVEQSLITLESDKASMEVPSPSAGKVESISVAVGDKVDEGSPLLVLVGEGDSSGGDDGDSSQMQATSDDGKNAAASEKSSDTGKGKSSGKSDGKASGKDAKQADKKGSGKADPMAPEGEPTEIPDEHIRRAHASPGVRRYARIHGADLQDVEGSGPKDRILKEDVIAHIKQAMESGKQGKSAGSAPEATGGAGIPPIPEVDFSKFGETETVELGRINKLSAKNLHRAWLNVPMVTHHDECDVTEMEAFRGVLKKSAKEGDPKVTGLAFHMKALAACLKAFPKFNASITADGESLVYKKYFNIGIAVDTPNGLVVPVFTDVDRKSINDLAVEMADMSKRARDKKLKPGEMQGASMTISSLGGIGGTAFTPIVNPPEVAILGITRASMKPVWDGQAFQPRLMCPLDMSYDHRVIDGADAARFMAHYCQLAGDIRRLLL